MKITGNLAKKISYSDSLEIAARDRLLNSLSEKIDGSLIYHSNAQRT
jgi:hypothetical protein